MFWNKEKELFNKWVTLGVVYMAEHDRVYNNRLVQELIYITEPDGSIKEPNINSKSIDYLCGKYLFRTFATNFVQVGAILEQKLPGSRIEELCELLSEISVKGTEGQFSQYEIKNLPKQLNEIPENKLEPIHMRNKGFVEETARYFARYFRQGVGSTSEMISPELVKLYCEALRFCIKDLDEASMVPHAMSMFAGARKAISERV